MRASLVLIASAFALPAEAQIDLRAPEARLAPLADALALETSGELIVSSASDAPCEPEPTPMRAVCVNVRGEALHLLVRGADGRTRDTALASTATDRTVAIVAASFLTELGAPAPVEVEQRYDSERPPREQPEVRSSDADWRVVGQIGLGASLVTSGRTSALGPALGMAMGAEAPFGLRVVGFVDGTYPVAIEDDTDLWLVRVGLSIGARIDAGPAAFHVLGRGATGFTPQRYGETSRYAAVALGSGGAAIGVSASLSSTDILFLLGLDVMQRLIFERPLELVSSVTVVSEFR